MYGKGEFFHLPMGKPGVGGPSSPPMWLAGRLALQGGHRSWFVPNFRNRFSI